MANNTNKDLFQTERWEFMRYQGQGDRVDFEFARGLERETPAPSFVPDA